LWVLRARVGSVGSPVFRGLSARSESVDPPVLGDQSDPSDPSDQLARSESVDPRVNTSLSTLLSLIPNSYLLPQALMTSQKRISLEQSHLIIFTFKQVKPPQRLSGQTRAPLTQEHLLTLMASSKQYGMQTPS
jgi:hypothetical protein